jgi:hypothetical protein
MLPGVAAGRDRGVRAVSGRSRLLQSGIGGLCLVLLLPQFLPGVNSSYLASAAIVCACGLLLAITEGEEQTSTSLTLFVWALLCRALAVTVCYALGVREGGPFLGPDSSTYFAKGAELAASNFHLDVHPVVEFGSWDVAQYYLFGGAIRYLHTDLFGLQMMNCGLIALAAPLVYGIARVMLPSAALAVGLAVALHPSLIALPAVDLLKDPSIIFGTALLIWVIVRLTREENPYALLPYFAAGLVAAVYLRMGRFYSFAYIELAFLAAVAFMMLRRTSIFKRGLAAVLVVTLFVVAEVLPARARWPLSPLMVASAVTYTLGTPEMSKYAAGLFDRLRISSGRLRPGIDREKGPIMVPVHIGPETGPFAVVGTIVSSLANLFRRLYGPFVWILPPDWHFKSLQAGDYLLYPGMLVWYGLLPFVVFGLTVTGWQIVKRKETRFGVVFLWCFTAVYFAQYLTINLSYRQRDVMLPVLLFFAFISLPHLMRLTRWKTWYASYWLALGLLAGTHLLVRAFLRA